MAAIPQFLIAAPASGSGKTTVCRGLMALLVRKGIAVQPFKCGPDYIDTKFHTAVCRRSSVNLDTFMASHRHVANLYFRYAQGAGACVVEGMMGMYDGYDRARGSSAEVAELLHLPVVLVVDAKSAAYSMAPLLSGFIHFRPEVRIAGVIFNRVGSARHYGMLQEVCADLQIPCLGYLPKDKGLEQGSRYLGLDFSQRERAEAMEHLVNLMEQHVDWRHLLEVTTAALPVYTDGDSSSRLSSSFSSSSAFPVSSVPVSVSVARNDESFSFLYAEHLDVLHRLGTVTFFDPESNHPLPPDTGLLYLPGGYPEKHAAVLSRATDTLLSIRRYIERGGRVLAECGGMMYLSQGICFDEPLPQDAQSPLQGSFSPWVQALPFLISARQQDRKLSLGYRQFTYQDIPLRGHEFHYTQFAPETAASLPASIAQVYNAKGEPVSTPIFRYKNVIASYTHLYWGEVNPMRLF